VRLDDAANGGAVRVQCFRRLQDVPQR
jgi:hypothetical protein